MDLDVTLHFAIRDAPSPGTLASALYAVLELHKHEHDVCAECTGEYIASWPCPTVKAIAEELNVDAAH